MNKLLPWIGKRIASAFIFVAFALLFIVAFVYAAMTYPSTTPSGETQGGKFSQYFANMFTGDCPDWQAVVGFTVSGTKKCKEFVIKTPVNQTFAKDSTFTVPSGVTALKVTVRWGKGWDAGLRIGWGICNGCGDGAGGGGGGASGIQDQLSNNVLVTANGWNGATTNGSTASRAPGNAGQTITSTLTVTPGQVLKIYVGWDGGTGWDGYYNSGGGGGYGWWVGGRAGWDFGSTAAGGAGGTSIWNVGADAQYYAGGGWFAYGWAKGWTLSNGGATWGSWPGGGPAGGGGGASGWAGWAAGNNGGASGWAGYVTITEP